MSGPWDNYAPAATGKPWENYAGSAPADTLSITPDPSLAPAPRLLDVMRAPLGAASYLSVPKYTQLLAPASISVAPHPDISLPVATAAGEGLGSSLVRAVSAMPMLAGGVHAALGDQTGADAAFHQFDTTKALADKLQTDAEARSKAGAYAGNVLGIVPQALAPELLALGALSHGTDLAASHLQDGGSLDTAEKLFGTGTTAAMLMNLLPGHVGSGTVRRILTGGAIAGGTGLGEQLAEHQLAPTTVAAPTTQGTALNTAIGSLLAGVLGHGAPAEGGSVDDTIRANLAGKTFAAPGSDGSLRLGDNVPLNGTFHPGYRPDAPAPVGTVHVTPSGEAFTPQQGATTLGQAIAQALAHPTPRYPALPAPSIAVDPSVPRGANPVAQQAASADQQAMQDARDAQHGELAQQGIDDTPPWWMAAQGAETAHATPTRPAPAPAIAARPPAVAAPDAPPTRAYMPTGRNDSRGRPILQPAIDYRHDTLVHWLGANGGINFDELAKQTGTDRALLKDPAVMRPFGRVGYPALRKNGGMGLDQLRERMQEDGWLPPDNPDEPASVGLQEAVNLAHEALNGQPIHHPYEGADERLAQAHQALHDSGYFDVPDTEATHPDDALAHYAEHAASVRADLGHDLSEADTADALSLRDLGHRALALGAAPQEVVSALDGSQSDAARNLWSLIKSRENPHADTQGFTQDRAVGRERSQPSNRPALEPRQAGRVAEDPTDPYAAHRATEPHAVKASDSGARDVAPATEASQEVSDARNGLFGAPTARDHLNAAERAKDAQRNGRAGGKVATGDGGLFDGPRPEQTRVPDAVDSIDPGQQLSIDQGNADADRTGIRAAVEKALGPALAARVEYLHGYEGLPEAMRQGVLSRNSIESRQGRTAAMYSPTTGRVFLFTDATTTPERALWHVAHEIAGHEGLRALLGDRLNQALGIARQNPTVAALAAEIHKQRNLTAQMAQTGRSHADGLLLSVEEALSELAAAVKTGDYGAIKKRYNVDVPPGMRASMRAAIANFLKRLKAMLGDMFGKHTFSDEDVRSLLDAAWEAVKRKHAGEPTASVEHPDGSSSLEQVVYHGTPHTVDRFSLQKIGTFDPTDPSIVNDPQTDHYGVQSSSRDMFTTTRGDRSNTHAPAIDRPNTPPEPASTAGHGQGQLPLRPDATPALTRLGDHAIDDLLRRAGGSVLADSIARDFREKGTAQLVGQTPRTIHDFAALAQVYRNPVFETLHYVFVDDAGRVVGESAISSRLPAAADAFPDDKGFEWVEATARQYGATGFWLTHNHPSGDPTPSTADIHLTRTLDRGLNGVRMLGHVVLDHTQYATIDGHGTVGRGTLTGNESDPTRAYRGIDIKNDKVSSRHELAALGRRLADLTPDNSIAAVVTGTKNQVTLVTALPLRFLDHPDEAMLKEMARSSAGYNVHLVIPASVPSSAHAAVANLMRKGLVRDAAILTHDGEAYSLAYQGSIYGGAIHEKLAKGALVSQVFEKHSDPYDHLQDMPSRRPGESQAAYLRRVLRKNGEDVKAATALAKNQRVIGRQLARGMMATQARQLAIADAAMRQARATFDKTPKVINYASVDQFETGQPITDPDFRAFIATMQGGYDQRIAAIHALAPDALQELIPHYMAHVWEDTGKALKWWQSTMAKRPLAGDKSFLKQRSWPTMKEGMASGLKPVSDNPVDWTLLKYQQMDRMIGLLQFQHALKQRGWLMKLEPGQRAPEGFASVDDPAFRIAAGLNGSYAIPELLAKDLNHYLAPGLERFGAWRSLRAVQNAMISWNLGFSAFHAGFTSIDNVVTHAAVGLQRLAIGDIAGGLKAIATAIPTMVTSPFEGGKLRAQWAGATGTDPHTAALLDLLEQGGARAKMSNEAANYANALPSVLRTVRQLQAPGALSDALDSRRRMAAAQGTGRALAQTGWDTIKGAGHVISAIGEVGSYAIHHVLVPNQKMAARVTLLKFELDRYASKLGKEKGDYAGIVDAMNPDVARQLASEVTDKVDFRLGQLTYDNFFMPKVARQLAQFVLMAPGWLAGSVQTMTGALRDTARTIKPAKLVGPLDKAGTIHDAHRGRFTSDQANLLMLMLLVGGAGALAQYLMTGKPPESLKDMVAPRTGRTNPDGSDERLVAPSYLKDHYEFFDDFPKGALTMLGHKLNPSLRTAWELAHNADYFGDEIHNPHDSIEQQSGQIASYLLKSFLPFTASNARRSLANGDGAGTMAANFVGVTPAPASIARSRFQAFVAKGGEQGWSYPASTPQQVAYRARLKAAEDAMRTGQAPDTTGLDPKDAAHLAHKVQTGKPELQFDRLGLEDKLDAYQLATPKERADYHLDQILARIVPSRSIAFRRLPADEQQAVFERLQQIRAAAGTP